MKKEVLKIVDMLEDDALSESEKKDKINDYMCDLSQEGKVRDRLNIAKEAYFIQLCRENRKQLSDESKGTGVEFREILEAKIKTFKLLLKLKKAGSLCAVAIVIINALNLISGNLIIGTNKVIAIVSLIFAGVLYGLVNYSSLYGVDEYLKSFICIKNDEDF